VLILIAIAHQSIRTYRVRKVEGPNSAEES
jgi:hypothetical protein